MQELIDFDSMPVAFNRTQNSGPVFGPTNLPCHEHKPALMQLPAAATTVGCAPEPAVQEAGTGPNPSRPSISMQDVMDVDSMLSAHDAAHGFAPETMHVTPEAATCSHDPWFSGPAVLHESVPSPSRIIPPWGPKDAVVHEVQAQTHALPMHNAATNDDDDSDAHSPIGLWDDQPWSEAEQEHQMARQRRKDRQALRPIARPSEGQVSPPTSCHQLHHHSTREVFMSKFALTRAHRKLRRSTRHRVPKFYLTWRIRRSLHQDCVLQGPYMHHSRIVP